MLNGCSLKETKIYVQPKKATFIVADINVSTTPPFKPRDINISKDKLKITTSVNTFLKIKEITKKLRVEVKIYKEAFESLKRQVLNYRAKVKERVEDE